jgi:hypothetical protein
LNTSTPGLYANLCNFIRISGSFILHSLDAFVCSKHMTRYIYPSSYIYSSIRLHAFVYINARRHVLVYVYEIVDTWCLCAIILLKSALCHVSRMYKSVCMSANIFYTMYISCYSYIQQYVHSANGHERNIYFFLCMCLFYTYEFMKHYIFVICMHVLHVFCTCMHLFGTCVYIWGWDIKSYLYVHIYTRKCMYICICSLVCYVCAHGCSIWPCSVYYRNTILLVTKKSKHTWTIPV